MGNEPVYQGDELIGLTTSGAYGHAVGCSLAFAYVPPDKVAAGTEFEILMFGQRRKAWVLADAAWDPGNERVRG
jgi:dimethylglycine dehydrogenase